MKELVIVKNGRYDLNQVTELANTSRAKFQEVTRGIIVNEKGDLLGITKPRSPVHIHSYGGEAPFFKALTEGKLLGSKCMNKKCDPAGKEGMIFMPYRVYCPDCLEKLEDIDMTKVPAKIHTHITVARPGAFNEVPMPCHLISVEVEGVATLLMSYLMGAEPKIGLPVKPVFNTKNPTYSIIDLHWEPVE